MKSLRSLKRYNLEFVKIKTYFEDVLTVNKPLSKEILALVDFTKGQFFTLLPEDANFKELYDFHRGWILPKNPVLEQISKGGKKSFYSWTPKLNSEIAQLIYDKMKSYANSLCLFEDVVTEPGDSYTDFGKQYGFWHSNGFYISLNHENVSPKLAAMAMNQSSIIWHTLFLLTETQSGENSDEILTSKNIHQLISKAKLLILGAYDGEAYVFWEPDNKNFLKLE